MEKNQFLLWLKDLGFNNMFPFTGVKKLRNRRILVIKEWSRLNQFCKLWGRVVFYLDSNKVVAGGFAKANRSQQGVLKI